MTEYLISEAARATGFTESALRFYVQEGVVVPERTTTGYRSYGDGHLESLRFVARGKQLGLSLDEITELLALLEEDECAPVQTRIQQLVAKRISQAQERIAELMGFTAQLQRAAARLGVHTPDGACDDECGCRSDPDPSPKTTEWDFIPLAGESSADIACSLRPDLVGGRIDDWRMVLASAKTRVSISNGVRIDFDRDVEIAALAELAAAEQSCCAFFRFNLGVGSEGVTLDVTGPEDAQDVIASVFGAGHELENEVVPR